MKKPVVIILIIAVFLLILLGGACFLIYTYVLPIFVSNTDTLTGGPEVSISVGEEDSDDVVNEEDEVRVCDKIMSLSQEGAFSGSASITDDSDSNACFFLIGNTEYGLIDLFSRDPQAEMDSLKSMYYTDEIEEISIPGSNAAYWSTMGGILMVWDGDRIITINSSANDKADIVSVITAYLN